jgi:hypothetical protein
MCSPELEWNGDVCEDGDSVAKWWWLCVVVVCDESGMRMA